MIDKNDVLVRLDIPKFYKEAIPSLGPVNGKGEALGLCQFHDDTNPSLSVNLETGLFNCFACGRSGDLFSFYQEVKGVGFTDAVNDLANRVGLVAKQDPPQKVVGEYVYVDGKGIPLYMKRRLEPGKGGRKKEFHFLHPDETGRLRSGRGGTPVLYNLPQVTEASTVFVFEGEGKADLGNEWGLASTSLDGGAGSPVLPVHLAVLEGKDIAILPDNDASGKRYAERFAAELHRRGGRVKVVELDGLPPKGDVLDWVKAEGNDKRRFLELVANTSDWKPEFKQEGLTVADDEPEGFNPQRVLISGGELLAMDIQIEWVVENLVAKNAVNLFFARGGMGKTTLTMQLAGAVSRGIPFLGLPTAKLPVVYIDYENSRAVLSQRARAIDVEVVQFWDSSNSPAKLDRIEWLNFRSVLAQYPEALIIIDTLRSSQSGNENDSQDMCEVMGHLRELRDLGATVVLLHHTPKATDTNYKGSGAIFDMSDQVLALYRVKNKGVDEESDEEDDPDGIYRFGTKDKTRYKPFTVFLQFDQEGECFIVAPDPEEEDLEVIRDVIERLARSQGRFPKQKEVIASLKNKIAEKRVVGLLRKGDGRYWRAERRPSEKNALIYKPMQFGSSPDVYRAEKLPNSKGVSQGEEVSKGHLGQYGPDLGSSSEDGGESAELEEWLELEF